MARVFDWIRKALVKPHYRKLPNGKIIWIDQYRDSRKDAGKNLAAYRHTAVHADDNSTTVVEGNKLKTYKHTPADEMTEEAIHNYLGQTTPIDETHVWRHWKYNPELRAEHEGIEMSDSHDLNEVFDTYLKSERANAKAEGREPIWNSRDDVRKTIEKYEIKPMLKSIKKKAGAAEFTSKADHPTLYKHILNSKHADYHEKAEAKMGLEHGEAAKAYWAKVEKENLAASNLRPQDCPQIPHISSEFPLFAHQAEVLAKLNKMKTAIVDVDMGGGKGLLLPYDAINLMHQGKVKRPLIVATGMTLHANAKKILEYTNGSVNVFVFDNDLIKQKYGGDIEKMVEDIKNAPPNTIFMTSYDNIAYNAGLSPEEAEDPTKQYQRAQRLSGANFDLVSLDECFHPDTLIETIDGQKRIADIKVGDLVRNCLGFSEVIATKHKKLDRRVVLGYNGVSVTCSDRHPFLTERGWVLASDLREGDNLVRTSNAMRVVREHVCSEVESKGDKQESFLWNILLGEMAYERYSEIPEILGGSQAEYQQGEVRRSESKCVSQDETKKPYGKSCNTTEDAFNIARYWAQAEKAIQEREDGTGSDTSRGFGSGLDLGVPCSEIQDRPSSSSSENSSGSGWGITQHSQKASFGCSKDSDPRFIRLDSIEVYEQGSDERNPEGLFYDLSVAGHPSFSVSGVVVRNCHKIKNPDSGRHKAMQYFSGAPYKRLATGTFISKDPADVVGQLSWLYPGKTQNVDEFSRQYGFTKTKEGYNWDDKGVKQLREDLLSQGFISIRRTNWMHQLPERNEKISVVKLKPKAAIANEMAIDDAFDAIQALADTDPKIAEELRRLQGDQDDDDDAPTGKVIDAINTLTGIVDHPHEFAAKVKSAKALCDKAGVDYTYQEDAWKKGYDGEEGEENIPHDVKRAQAFLRKFRPKTLQAILNLHGEVSAKAEDAYAKMREHFKDPKNGKFIVFTKRINSARHVFDNLPPDLKKDAVYFDGSNKEGLEPFLQHDKGPKIFIACDEAIKEGVNMQAANALYRYDLGWPVAKGTLISCEKGLVPIETLSGHELFDTATKPYHGHGLNHRGFEKILKIDTEYGWSCRMAVDHPVLVLTPDCQIMMKRADEINTDDYVGIKAEKSSLWPKESSYSIDEAYFVGYMVSNGWLRNKSTGDNRFEIGFSDSDVGHREHFGRLCNSIAKCTTSDSVKKATRNAYGKDLYQKCLELGLESKKAPQKRIPQKAFTCGESETEAIICGLWCDGSTNKSTPAMYSSSIELLRDIQLLLQRLGVISKINTDKRSKKEIRGRSVKTNTQYVLQVAGGKSANRMAEIFSNHLTSGDRNEKTLKWCRKRINGVPEQVTFAESVPNVVDMMRNSGMKFPTWWYNLRVKNASYRHLDRLEYRDSLIERLLETKLTWTKVTSVTEDGMDDVYCVSNVEVEHNFVANGIVVSNTPGDAEQSYGRVWRFGQKRPVKIHVGISDGTMDVTKYARLMSRHNSNMKVVSGYDAVPGFLAFRMSVDNIRANRSADQLEKYEQVGKAVLDYQKEENKKVVQVYGDKKYDIAAPGTIAGSKKASGPQYETLEDEQPTEPVKSGRKTAPAVTKPASTADAVKKPSNKESSAKPEPKAKPSSESKEPVKKESDLTADENNEAAEHHLKHAAHHLANENKGLAKKHWHTAIRHLKQAGKGKRDAHLAHLARDKEAFRAFAHSMKNKMKDAPHAYVEHKHDKRLPPEDEGKETVKPEQTQPKPTKAHDTMGRTQRGIKEKKIEAKSSSMDALKQAIAGLGYDLNEVDDEMLGEMDEDLKTYSAHMEGGKDSKAYWKAWAKTHGGNPDDDHKAAIERAAEVLKQRRGR